MAGKGDRRRKTLVPQSVVDANYETIFGKFVPLYMRKQIPDEPLDAYNEERLVSKYDKEADKNKKEDNK